MRNCENCYHFHMCDLQYRLEEHQDCKHYIDKSLIVELPCKVGDVVYAKSGCFPFRYDHGNIIPCEAFVFRVTKRNKLIKLRPLVEGAMGARHLETWFPISAFGKTVFLTKEEAEKKLKEYENETNV